MLKRHRHSRTSTEINAGSMADIAFLLLIFFLVTSQLSSNKGLLVKLPPYSETAIAEVTELRNLCDLAIKSDGKILVRGEETSLIELKTKIKQFITNPANDLAYASSPAKAIISLRHDNEAVYDDFIKVYNVLLMVYDEIRNEASQKAYSKDFNFLDENQSQEIKKKYPILISEADVASEKF